MFNFPHCDMAELINGTFHNPFRHFKSLEVSHGWVDNESNYFLRQREINSLLIK